MALPIVTLDITSTIYGLPAEGDLIYKYSPFQNLQNLDPAQEEGLSDLRMLASEANMDVNNPIELDIEQSYDNSVNLVVNDKINPLKLVNSRFYLLSSDQYAIADRKGNLDTNIYTKSNFKIESGLIKTVRTIVGLDFKGVSEGGILPVGNYNFYFKLADSDGNESDFIAESGQVVCYIGAVNEPSSIRGGLLNEDSGKLVKFKLNNIDLAYDYINIYYTRNTGDGDVENTEAYKITQSYSILGTSTELSITGYEDIEKITVEELNIQYTYFDSAKTVASCQNMLFVGNTKRNYDIYSLLEKYSLFITPTLTDSEDIGNVNSSYVDFSSNGGEYYNPKNIYYRLGYWDEEIYRLGIVYILDNYTLSPVFNIRGKKEISKITTFFPLDKTEEINYDDNYIIENTDENVKGVFKVNTDNTFSMFNGSGPIRPIGIKLNFDPTIFDNSNMQYPSIDTITRGFFIVRQKRLPNILAQGISIATTTEGNIPVVKANTSIGSVNFAESFLKKDEKGLPILGRSIYQVKDTKVKANALLCPEASLRKNIFGSLFNSSTFQLQQTKYKPHISKFLKLDTEDKLFSIGDLEKNSAPTLENKKGVDLLFINPNTELINNNNTSFSSVAGSPYEPWKHVDPEYGDLEKLAHDTTIDEQILSKSVNKTRGVFNSYIGMTSDVQEQGKYYNVYNNNYNFSTYWLDYFKIRYNDASQFSPISDRIGWSDFPTSKSVSCYRGDCYINTYAHRMIWNFIDPELPTNNKIVDIYTWFKNYKVKTTKLKTSTTTDFVVQDNSGEFNVDPANEILYKKLLPAFTYKSGDIIDDIDSGKDLNTATLLTPEAKKYQKYVDSNGEFGYGKLNRPDINAVGLGHWIIFKICSNFNLALRDEDFSNPAEEVIHKRKRSFYPYSSADLNHKLPESTIINSGVSKTLGQRAYFELPDVPFIKTHFNSRINNSNLAVESVFKDGSRLFQADNFQDYTMEHGELVRLVEWFGSLIAIMEHGILMIPVNERAMMMNAQGENVYVNTDTVLPKNPRVLSNTYGSTWSQAIVKTSRFIYGIDTVAKKIWRTNGDRFEIISNLKIQKFLNDNVNLKKTDKDESIGFNLIKAHYNAFKEDVIFTYKYGLEYWSLCWNELLEKWITRYTWFPEFSENINNIFYTFASKDLHKQNFGKLYKHGFAGPMDDRNEIKPTVWYENQHRFEIEFVVGEVQGIQKIFNNLKIISNKAEPQAFTIEVVGEGYDWYKYKEVISWMENHSFWNTAEGTENLELIMSEDGYYLSTGDPNNNYTQGYEYLLTHTIAQIEADFPDFPTPYGMSGTDMFLKLPYIPKVKTQSVLDEVDWEELGYPTILINDLWNGEDRVLSYQQGKTIRHNGRIKGNMDYVEDSWDVQIQPIKFRYAFMKGGELKFTSLTEMKVRDKYTKIRVIYDGKKLAVINAIKTLFTISYA